MPGAGGTLAWTDVQRRPRIVLVLSLLAGSAARARPAAAEPRPDDPDAVYDVSLPIDGAIVAVTAAGALIPYTLASHLIHPAVPVRRHR